jgi:hypothetical protein
MDEHGIEPIQLVCINLYPFEQTIRRPDVTREEAIEQIDIGGPSMLRSAAKNHIFVATVTTPAQYDQVVTELQQNDGRSLCPHGVLRHCHQYLDDLTQRCRLSTSAPAHWPTGAYPAVRGKSPSAGRPVPNRYGRCSSTGDRADA